MDEPISKQLDLTLVNRGRLFGVVVVVQVEAVDAAVQLRVLGHLGRQDGDEVLPLEVGPLIEPGEEVVHLLVAVEVCPVVGHPPFQHSRFCRHGGVFRDPQLGT